MKNLFVLAIALFVISCNAPQNEDLLKLIAEKDSILNEANMKDDAINEFLISLNEIEANLSEIKEKENIVTILSSQNAEMGGDISEKINEDIQLIYKMMLENKDALKSMKGKLKRANVKIAELENMIIRMTKQLEEKDAEIESLKTKLIALNIEIDELKVEVDTLRGTIESKENTIIEKTDELNIAYYVFGTDKELRDNQVITKEGGFIGIGKIEKLMQDFNKDYFEKIDIRKTRQIKLYSKKARLITTHPSSSYKLYGTEKADSLVILNPQEFWKASKYLVIVVD
jgi:chromosome segregation ATPase